MRVADMTETSAPGLGQWGLVACRARGLPQPSPTRLSVGCLLFPIGYLLHPHKLSHRVGPLPWLPPSHSPPIRPTFDCLARSSLTGPSLCISSPIFTFTSLSGARPLRGFGPYRGPGRTKRPTRVAASHGRHGWQEMLIITIRPRQAGRALAAGH